MTARGFFAAGMLIGQPAMLHQVLATTTPDFDALVPAFDENEPVVGAPKWIVAQRGMNLV